MPKMINLTIDGMETQVEAGSTILQAAETVGVHIPTLCYMNLHELGFENRPASCRICVVEVVGRRNLAPACATPVAEGMVVRTNTAKVLEARRTVMELILSDHPKDCLTCDKSGQCELQALAENLGIRRIRVTGKAVSEYPMDSSDSIVRDPSKCIMCRRCENVCNQIQTVGALSAVNRGFDAVVATAFNEPIRNTVCVGCGQCVQACPVGALTVKSDLDRVIEALNDPEKVVVVNTAPAVRVALGEEFGYEPGSIVTGQMVAALRKIGFNYVFDTDFAADMTIMEEAHELVGRLTAFLKGEKADLPLLTSCCPAWVSFIETQFPDMLNLPSSAKSPMEMFGATTKTYFAEKIGVEAKNIFSVAIMPCTAKKAEARREEMGHDGVSDIDVSLTTTELAALIKQANLDLWELDDEEYDDPMGESTGAAVIFGKTGGVMEAALRTAYEWVTGKSLDNVEFEDIRTTQYGIKVAHVPVGDVTLNVAVASGLGNARAIMEEIRNGNPNQLHAVEIMACPGGCVNGGGQPHHFGDMSIVSDRQRALYEDDQDKSIRKSHENPSIQKIYQEYFGEPGSEKAHHLLHTTYQAKERI